MTKRIALSLALLAALALPAQAACIAEYKASRGSPPKFSHGFVTLPEGICTAAEALPHVRATLAEDAQDWKRVEIISIEEE